MRRLIILGAILAGTALLVLLAHKGALTEKIMGSHEMRITVTTQEGSYFVQDEIGRPGKHLTPQELKNNLEKYRGEQIGWVYKYTKNPGNCTAYCSGGDCWEFCW